MLSSTRTGIGICLTIALMATAALIGWDIPLLWRIIAVALLIISIGTGVVFFFQEKLRQQERLVQASYKHTVELMSHQRHDWMNDLQLLYGYVRLNKMDRLIQCIDQMKHNMNEESRIAKLGNPELVMYLMRQRLTGSCMPVEVHIADHIELTKFEVGMDHNKLTDLVIKGVQLFRTAPKAQDEYVSIVPLKLTFMQQDDQLLIRYEYEGKLLRPDDVNEQFEIMATERGVRLEQLSNKEQHVEGINHKALQWVLPCMTE